MPHKIAVQMFTAKSGLLRNSLIMILPDQRGGRFGLGFGKKERARIMSTSAGSCGYSLTSSKSG